MPRLTSAEVNRMKCETLRGTARLGWAEQHFRIGPRRIPLR
jgi:hypothetical protein